MSSRLYVALIALLVAANFATARAHNFWYAYWPRSNMQVFLANDVTEAEAARQDWATHTHLRLTRSLHHTDISVFAKDYGKTGWEGLTVVKQWGLDYPWRCGGTPLCRMIHVHSRFNSLYLGPVIDGKITTPPARRGAGPDSDVRGVFCMEIGHALGLAHEDKPPLALDQRDCMSKNIDGVQVNVTKQHSWDDVNRRY